MAGPLKLRAIGKIDSNGKEYYFTRPDLPCSVDFSDIVLFVHPWEDEDGKFGADIVIKKYTRKSNNA